MNVDHPERDIHVPTTYLKAAAGGAGGSWYVLMEGLARLVAEIYPPLHIEVVEGGGVANQGLVRDTCNFRPKGDQSRNVDLLGRQTSYA
jgi:hypothetical protein